MRKNIVAGNWKMNKIFPEGIELIKEIKEKSKELQNVKLIVAPPYIFLNEAGTILSDKQIGLGAQNCSNKINGAYTGEISPEMLTSTNTEYVILGHSERRTYYNETDELINEKIKICIDNRLKPIICCGEVLQEREDNKHFDVIEKQIHGMLKDISEEQIDDIIIAYEPVWAIGTGKTASSEQAQEMHQFIRNIVSKLYNNETANNISILYGGSCKPTNAKELFSNPDVDGGLIGGASLKANDFIEIAKSF
ncbi:MAG: triose-phosphate isomerase [Bacteroidales bacterium]|nr:triose-phosphate isomerase [Bacteroidales bacterium]